LFSSDCSFAEPLIPRILIGFPSKLIKAINIY
jgi:hypothetical protein